jgi:hypothetical protein
MVVVATLLLSVSVASAQPTPQVTVKRRTGGVTVTMKIDQLVVAHQLTRDSFDLTVQHGADRVGLTGNTAGDVRISHGTRTHAFAVRSATESDVSKTKSLLSGSSAVKAFDAVMATDWARTANEARPLTAARAMLALMQGRTEPVLAMAALVRRNDGPRIQLAQRYTSSGCWSEYQRDVINYTYELEACVQESRYSWNPLHLAWCAYSYNFQTSLALIWLFDCNGY